VTAMMAHLESVTHGTLSAGIEAHIAHILTLDNHALWVAEDKGQAVGMITTGLRPTLYHAGPPALIDDLIVAPYARGRGAGRA